MEDGKNIWCIAKYLPDRTLGPFFSPISRIKTGPTSEVTSNAEIGASLLESFFPQPLPYPLSVQLNDINNTGVAAQLTAPPMQKEDVRAAIFKASPLKRPGQDNIPALVWQKLWPVLHEQVFSLFQSFYDKDNFPKNEN